MLHLLLLGQACRTWTGCRQHVTPWKMSERFSRPVIQMPLRRANFEGRDLLLLKFMNAAESVPYILISSVQQWDVSSTTALTDLSVLQFDVCLSRNKLHLHPDIETRRSHCTSHCKSCQQPRAPAGRRICPATVYCHDQSPRKHLAGFLFFRNAAAKSLK